MNNQQIGRRSIFTALLPLALLLHSFSLLCAANPANSDARLETLYPQFIAPCCWRENLLVHHSPKAEELRAEIKQLADSGKSDEEIRREIVDRYSLRILSEPEGVRGQWLSWTPVAAGLTGLAAVAFVIRRSLRRNHNPPETAANPLPELPPEFDN